MGMFRRGNKIKNLRRFSTISRVLIKHGCGNLLERWFQRSAKRAETDPHVQFSTRPTFPSPVRIRQVLEELGPSFVKLGQLMSTRADIFPSDYIEEFKKLQDCVPPVPLAQIRLVIENELRQPLEQVFSEFSEQPLAAASVAQVHLGRMTNGDQVAVKVLRPGIAKMIRDDIRLMYYLAEKIERNLELGQVLGAVNLVKEFERTVFRELDMFMEAGSIEKFARNFSESHEIKIPRVYWEVTSKSVLVMEHIAGIKMDQVEEIQRRGLDPKEIAMIGLRSFSRQLMEFGFFHADPHPGNTLVMDDGRVGLVDFGITGYLDEELMFQIANVFLGYAEHDYEMVMDALLEAGLISEDKMDLVSFRTDLKDISEPFYGRSLQTISVRDVYDLVIQLVLKYQLRLPRNLLLLLKTFIQTEALGKILGSDASILEVTRPYARKLLQRGYDARKVFKNVGKESQQLSSYLKLAPRFVTSILRQVAQGRQRIELWHGGFHKVDTKIEKGVNRLTVGMVISASTIAASLILNSSQTVVEFDINMLGMHSISLTAILGVTGYVIATILGVWLIISIFRSGSM